MKRRIRDEKRSLGCKEEEKDKEEEAGEAEWAEEA